jgi:uncharacterized protein YhbP (UPF0306 family)
MPDKRIVNFIKDHHLLTLATSKKNTPYCSNVFYIYDEKNNSLIFSSDIKTRHAQEFSANLNVAGSIALETRDVKKIQGVQLLGEITELKGIKLEISSKKYLTVYPYARIMNPHLWEMKLTFIKMTHNKLEFGKKLVWKT